MEGEITKVVDGDTVYARITKLPKKIGNYSTTFKVGQIIKLRIPSIDTLEEHVPNKEVDPVEKAYALRDHAFAESLLPVGTKVIMVSPN
jgi:lipoprotein, possible nuclease